MRFPILVLTWYSTMTSLRSSARSHTAILSASSTCSAVSECSDRICNLSLMPSRALRPFNERPYAVDGEHALEQGFPPSELIRIPGGIRIFSESI